LAAADLWVAEVDSSVVEADWSVVVDSSVVAAEAAFGWGTQMWASASKRGTSNHSPGPGFEVCLCR
jgi:hypothetical protein